MSLSDPRASQTPKVFPYILAGIVCVVLHFLWDFPTLSSPAANLRGWPGDNLVFLWNLWWVSTSIWDLPGLSSYHCPLVFSPEGLSFAFHTHTYLYGLIYAFFQIPWRVFPSLGRIPSPVLAYNLICVGSTVLTGLGGVALCRLCGVRSTAGTLLGALVLAFCNLRLFSLFGHLNLVGTEFLVWSVFFHVKGLVRSGTRPRIWWFFGGILWGLAFVNSITYGVFAGFFWLYCVVWGTVGLPSGTGRLRYLAGGPFLSVVAFLLVGGDCIVHLAAIWFSGDYLVASLHQSRFSDFLNFLLPSDYGFFLGPRMFRLRRFLGMRGGDGVAYVGWATLWTAGWGIAWLRKSRRPTGGWTGLTGFWGGLAVLGGVTSLGERLVVAGHRILPLPYRLTRVIPILNNLRIPERQIVFVMIPAAILTGVVADHLLRSEKRKRVYLFLAGWALLFLLDSVYRFDTTMDIRNPPAALPRPVVDILTPKAIRHSESTLWNLPSSFSDRMQLWWQTQVGRPLVFGTSSRVPLPIIRARVDGFPFL